MILIKGDISGIQDFIFNIKSEGAARTLKGHSFYVQALSRLCIQYITDRLDNCEVIYNGGGNFYLHAESSNEKLKQIQTEISRELIHDGLGLILHWIEINDDDLENFGAKIKQLNNEISFCKLHKCKELDYDEIFQPYAMSDASKNRLNEDNWKNFVNALQNASNYKIVRTEDKNPGAITNNAVNKLNYSYILSGDDGEAFNQANKPETYIVKQLPVWSENLMATNNDVLEALNNKRKEKGEEEILQESLIEFDALAKFAEKRTGTDNIATLKLDVDNLGHWVSQQKSIEDFKNFSRKLSRFFEYRLNELLNEKTSDGKTTYIDNLYTLYSGGDDCFIIGAWDTVFEFAKILRGEFVEYAKDKYDEELTFSASILLFTPNHPVSRFAPLAEEALSEAKAGEGKNRINVMGEVFTWEEYFEMMRIADALVNMIIPPNTTEGESRALLQKIYNSTKGFRNILKNSGKGILEVTKIWRLRFYLKDLKSSTNMEKIIEIYEDILLKNTLNDTAIQNIMIIPVAVRIAELKTRLKYKENGQS